jgi:hypothetical protein
MEVGNSHLSHHRKSISMNNANTQTTKSCGKKKELNSLQLEVNKLPLFLNLE